MKLVKNRMADRCGPAHQITLVSGLLVLALSACKPAAQDSNAGAQSTPLPAAVASAGSTNSLSPSPSPSPSSAEVKPGATLTPNIMSEKVSKTEEEWRKQLSPEQYKVTRKKGTERAFTGKLWDTKDKGVFACVCCDLPLFSSETKFESGTGWPSFYAPLKSEHVGEVADNTLFMKRTEVICNRCDAHLGHVFDDGPQPTNLRYCINSASLKFEPAEDKTEPKAE